MSDNDILQIIPDDDLVKLRDSYKKFLPRTAHVYNFLNCIIKWKTQRPDKNYATVLAPYGNWDHGMFVAIQKWSCYDVFLSSLEENGESLYKALVATKQIEWNNLIVLYAIRQNHFPRVLQALEEVQFPIDHSNFYDVWWMSKENALKLNIEKCPPDVYVKKLEPIHAGVINSHWPSTFPGSEQYLATFIELNGGYGVFLKSCNTLVAWILKNQIGFGALQTLQEHKRKGYGSLVTRHMTRKIGEDGEDPLGTVLQTNVESQAMFKKIGFTIVESVVFTEAEIKW